MLTAAEAAEFQQVQRLDPLFKQAYENLPPLVQQGIENENPRAVQRLYNEYERLKFGRPNRATRRRNAKVRRKGRS